MSEGNWSIERYLRYASRIESDDEPIHLYVTLDNIHEMLEWKDKADKFDDYIDEEHGSLDIKALNKLIDKTDKYDELEIIINTHYDDIEMFLDDLRMVIER